MTRLRRLVVSVLSLCAGQSAMAADPQTSTWQWERLPPYRLDSGHRTGPQRSDPSAAPGTTPARTPDPEPPPRRPRLRYADLVGGSRELANRIDRARARHAELDRACRLWDGRTRPGEGGADDALAAVIAALRSARDISDLEATRLQADALRYLQSGRAGGGTSPRAALLVLQTLWLRAALDLGCLADGAAIAHDSQDGLGGADLDLMDTFERVLDENRKAGLGLHGNDACSRTPRDYTLLWRAMEREPAAATAPPDATRVPGDPVTAPVLVRDPVRQPDRDPVPNRGPRPLERTSAAPVARTTAPPPGCDADPIALDQRLERLGERVRDLVRQRDALNDFYREWYHRVPEECAAFMAAWREQEPILNGLEVGPLESDLKGTYACLSAVRERQLQMAANPAIGRQVSRMTHQLKRVDEHLITVYQVQNKKVRLTEGVESQLLAACRDPDR